MPILLAIGLAKLHSWSAHQHFCRRIGFIPRARGRARRRAARDFLKTIVALHKLEARARDALMQLFLYRVFVPHLSAYGHIQLFEFRITLFHQKWKAVMASKGERLMIIDDDSKFRSQDTS